MEKKFFSKLMMGVLFAASIFTLTACGEDDEPKVEDKFTTEYTFSAEFSADLLKTADVKAYILSPEGTVTEETVTKAKSTWTLKGNSIPDKAGVRFDFDPKSGNFSGDYQLGYKVNTTVTCLNNGKVVSSKPNSSDETYTVSAENLAGFYGTSLILAGQVNAKGEAAVTDGSNLDFGLNVLIIRPPFGGHGDLN